MSGLNFNELMKAAEEGGGETGDFLSTAGTFDAIVRRTNAGKSSNGKDMITTTFEVESGPHKGDVVIVYLTISPESSQALNIFFRQMRALGLPREYFAINPPLGKVAADMVGRRAQIVTKMEEYQGEMRAKISVIKTPIGGPSNANPTAGPVPFSGPVPTPMPMAHPVPQPVSTAPAPLPAPAQVSLPQPPESPF